MDPKTQMTAAQIRLNQHVGATLADFQRFVVSEMVHSWLEAQSEGTLDRLVAVWRQGLEDRNAEASRQRTLQTGLIQPVADAQKLILDTAVREIYKLFGDGQVPAPQAPPVDEQPTLIV